MSRSTADADVVDALTWNVPGLALRPSTGATAFRLVLGPPPWRLEFGDDVLSLAARGLLAERTGDAELSQKYYAQLLNGEFWASLLGRFLLAWSPNPDGERHLFDAFNQVRSLPRTKVKAHLLAKASLFAFDRDLGDLCVEALEMAIATATPRSRLRQALLLTAVNNGFLEGLPTELTRPTTKQDPLVDQDWIDHLALRSARTDLTDLLEASARSPWSWQFRSGRTSTDDIIAAELQATWAGAWWLRPALRRQLGSQALRSPPPSRDILLYALSMWIRGGGSDIGPVINLAEPHFDDTLADDLLRPLVESFKLPGIGDLRLAEVAVASWDLVSDSVLQRLVTRLPPSATEPIGESTRRFWALAVYREPVGIGSRLTDLDQFTLTLLSRHLPLAALDDLPTSASQRLLSAIIESRASGMPSTGAELGVAARLAKQLGADISGYVAAVGPSEMPEVIRRAPDVLTERQLVEGERFFRDAIQREATQATAGSGSFGGQSTSRGLSTVCEARRAVQRTTIDALIKIALDSKIPGHVRFDVLVALANLAVGGLLTERDLARIARVPEGGEPSFFASTPHELLRAGRLLVRAQVLSPEEIVNLGLLVRDRDPRVRGLAVDGSKLVLRRKRSGNLEAAIVAALYDPQEDVVTSALAAIAEARLTEPARVAAVGRLEQIFGDYGHQVRVEVVRAVKRLSQRQLTTRLKTPLNAILSAAMTDRSWQVRREASLARRDREHR